LKRSSLHEKNIREYLLKSIILIGIVLYVFVAAASAYTNLTTAQVHARLVAADTMLLLDVREVYEYTAGHIAEPDGQLPLTPVNMPWSSNVLSAEYNRLPQNMDIIVYCRSGGRSASASTFLENNEFTRIFNMTGGFSSWSYESRTNGYGDHSGKWVHVSDTASVSIFCEVNSTTSNIIFLPEALPDTDSLYVELHFASDSYPVPPDVPQSDIDGLFRVTVLDRFGLSPFVADSLVLSDTVQLDLTPQNSEGVDFRINNSINLYVPIEGWRTTLNYSVDEFAFYHVTSVLRRWYNIAASANMSVAADSPSIDQKDIQIYPNPFNGTLNILAPQDAAISIYDIRGRLLAEITSTTWRPDISVVSGLYFVRMRFAGKNVVHRVLYLK